MDSLPVRKFELTHRQLEVARLYSKGHTYPSIAEQLGISSKTVGSYLHIVRVKLRVKSREDLIAAIRGLRDGRG